MLNINKSLLTLGKCISTLAHMKKKKGVSLSHIPYRDSKLTKLLQDSLGGTGMALMIACVSPSSNNIAESIKTLRYASYARIIENKPIIQVDPREKLIMDLKNELKFVKNENTELKNILKVGPFSDKTPSKINTENIAESLETKKMLSKYIEENNTFRNEIEIQNQKNHKQTLEMKILMDENDRLVAKIDKLVSLFESNIDTELEKHTENKARPSRNSSSLSLNNHPLDRVWKKQDNEANDKTTNQMTEIDKLKNELSMLDVQLSSTEEKSKRSKLKNMNVKKSSNTTDQNLDKLRDDLNKLDEQIRQLE